MEQGFHAVQLCQGLVIGYVCLIGPYVDDEEKLLLQVIEDDDLVKKHEVEIVKAGIVFRPELQRRLGILDEVVRKVPDQAADEGRQPFQAGRPVGLYDLADQILRRIRPDRFFPFARKADDAVLAAQAQSRIVPDEGVTAPAVCIFHAFQQIAVLRQRPYEPQDFQGRTQIGI